MPEVPLGDGGVVRGLGEARTGDGLDEQEVRGHRVVPARDEAVDDARRIAGATTW